MELKRVLKLLPILIFSGLFGFFLWEVYFVSNNPGYHPPWHGWWITTPQLEGDVFYFRKKFYLSEDIKNAWLLVSGSDGFKVYLNGVAVGNVDLDTWFPLGIYDVTGRIHLGINALAIRVERKSFEGPTKAVIELGYEDTYGNKHYVFSDETWKLSNKEERDSTFGLHWYDVGFNDSGWLNAETLERPRGLWLNTDPRIYTTSADGLWFWAGEQREIYCQAQIQIPRKPRTAWIRLASRGGFRLLVNETRVDVQETVIGTETEGVPNEVLNIYDINPFLKHGNNTILINNYAEGPERGLYADGVIEGDGWSKTLDENDFKCFYSQKSTPLTTYKSNPGWISIKGKQIQHDLYIPIELTILSYSKLVVIFCIISVVFIGLTFAFSTITRLSFYSLSRAYFIPSLFLIFIYILRYDVRFYSSFPFQGKFLILSLCLIFLFWLLNPLINKIKIKDIPAWVPTMILVLIFLLGAFLRFRGMTWESLYADEAGNVLTAEGILERGYPSTYIAPEVPIPYNSASDIAPDLPPRYPSTSELVSYFQALSFIAFGKSEFSLRLITVVFSILTIPLLYYFGKMIGGIGVGLLASATYSLIPTSIGMSHFGRYPSQLAFFGLLTAFLAFVYLKTDKAKYLYLCGLSILLSYFSWQGCAFMIPALFLARIMMGNIKRSVKDIIILLIITTPIIGAHLSIRFLEYIDVSDILFGVSVASLTLSLFFLSPLYDPLYYIRNFFFIDSHQFLSILFFAGIPLVVMKFKTCRDFVFLYTIPLVTLFLMTNTLEVADYRYAFYLLPFLILCACGVLFLFLGYLGYNKENESLGFINSIFASIVLVLISSFIFLSLRNFPGITEGEKGNPNVRYAAEAKIASEFIQVNMEPGDVIISYQPHLLECYLDKVKVHYFFESRLLLPVLIIPRDSIFIPVHRRSGTPAVLSLNELKKIIGAGKRRVWMVEAPLIPTCLDNESREFLNENRKVVFERYITKVYLIGGG